MKMLHSIRGFRNNNPGNIRHGEHWKGLSTAQNDSDFCEFVSVEYGIRAIFKILDTYQRIHTCHTIESMIYRWAPPLENDTQQYIHTVSRRSEIPSHELLSIDCVPKVVDGIIFQENGVQPFDLSFIRRCKDL